MDLAVLEDVELDNGPSPPLHSSSNRTLDSTDSPGTPSYSNKAKLPLRILFSNSLVTGARPLWISKQKHAESLPVSCGSVSTVKEKPEVQKASKLITSWSDRSNSRTITAQSVDFGCGRASAPVQRVTEISSSFKATDQYLGFLTFLLCGVASLSCWQFTLALMPYIESLYFDQAPIGNSLLGVYQVGCVIVQIVLMFALESMQPQLIVGVMLLDAVLAFIFPVVIAYTSAPLRLLLAHIVAFICGACAGIICGCCLAVASAMPYNFIGAFSMGQGLAGIYSFVITIVFSNLYDLGSKAGLVRMMWLSFGICAGISVVSAVLLTLAQRQPWAKRQLTRYKEAKRLRCKARRWSIMWNRWIGEVHTSESGEKRMELGEISGQSRADAKENLPVRIGVAGKQDGCHENDVGVFMSGSNISDSSLRAADVADLENRQSRRDCDSAFAETRDGSSRERVDVTRYDCSAPNIRGSVPTEFDIRTVTNANDSATERMSVCRKEENVEVAVCSREGTNFEEDTCDKPHLPSRGWKYMLRSSGVYLLCIFLIFLVTLNLYPRVGPIMWSYPSFAKNGPQYIILFGVFCVGDFIGKCLMDLSKASPRLKFLMIPSKVLLPIVILRFVLVAFFLLGAYLEANPFFNAFQLYVVLMLLLAISNGWCITTSLLYACTSVDRFEEREVLGPASVLILQLGIMGGVYSALAYPAV